MLLDGTYYIYIYTYVSISLLLCIYTIFVLNIYSRRMNRSLMYGILTYVCSYLHCCTYGITLIVCMVFAVHTVFAMRMSDEQLSYAWYIHMHPYLHCLTYGLCNSSTTIQLPLYIYGGLIHVWYVCFHIFFAVNTVRIQPSYVWYIHMCPYL